MMIFNQNQKAQKNLKWTNQHENSKTPTIHKLLNKISIWDRISTKLLLHKQHHDNSNLLTCFNSQFVHQSIYECFNSSQKSQNKNLIYETCRTYSFKIIVNKKLFQILLECNTRWGTIDIRFELEVFANASLSAVTQIAQIEQSRYDLTRIGFDLIQFLFSFVCLFGKMKPMMRCDAFF